MAALRKLILDRWVHSTYDVVVFVVRPLKDDLIFHLYETCEWRDNIYYFEGTGFADAFYTNKDWVILDMDDDVDAEMIEHFHHIGCRVLVGMTDDPSPLDVNPSIVMDVVRVEHGQMVDEKCWTRKNTHTLPDIALADTPHQCYAEVYDEGVTKFVDHTGVGYIPSVENIRPGFYPIGTNVFFICDDRKKRTDQERMDRLYVIDSVLDHMKALNRRYRHMRARDMPGDDRKDIPLAYSNDTLVHAATVQPKWNSMPGLGPGLVKYMGRERRRQASNRLLWETIAQCISPEWMGPSKGRRLVIHPYYTIYLISVVDVVRVKDMLEEIFTSAGGFERTEWEALHMEQYTVVIPDNMRLSETIQPPREWLISHYSDRVLFEGDHRRLTTGMKRFTLKQKRTYLKMLTRLRRVYPSDITGKK